MDTFAEPSPQPRFFGTEPVTSAHDAALMAALESARVAAVNVARFRGHLPAPLSFNAESVLVEIGSLVVALRNMSVLGFDSDSESNRPPATSAQSQR